MLRLMYDMVMYVYNFKPISIILKQNGLENQECCNTISKSYMYTVYDHCSTMAPRKGGKDNKGKQKSTINEVITKECTINLHKRVFGM